MIEQSYISRSLAGLEDKFRAKYQLTDYVDRRKPVVIFGMYNQDDIRTYLYHKSEVVVVWQGMDAKDLHYKTVSQLKQRNAKHFSISHWIQKSLNEVGIENECLPISATIGENLCCNRGDSVYFYSSDLSQESADYYGEYMLEEIRRRTKLNVIRATWNTYPPEKLNKIYESCFINLRLTTFDGCPNTNLEMAMRGRRSIYNGNIPHSLRWTDVDDVCDTIMVEYENRKLNNKPIATDAVSFINSTNNIFKNL